MIRASVLALSAIVMATSATAQDSMALRKALVGRLPPELISADSDWLTGPSITLEKLRGRVVWLQFNRAESCVSYRSRLLKWEAEFTHDGLIVVEVSGGAALDFPASRQRATPWCVSHPVLWDEDNRNAKAYAISGWPTAYLIGSDGKVFWQGNPAALTNRKDDEAAFRKELKRQLEKSSLVERLPTSAGHYCLIPLRECGLGKLAFEDRR